MLHKIQYSAGRVEVLGTERAGFDGGLLVDTAYLFHAWCSCKQFQHHGTDAGARRCAVRDHKRRAALTVGDTVVYRGSVTHEHDNRFHVAAVDDEDRLTLTDDYLGDVTLSCVRRESVDPTGEPPVEMCACGHRRTNTAPAFHGRCMAYGCGCDLHQLDEVKLR